MTAGSGRSQESASLAGGIGPDRSCPPAKANVLSPTASTAQRSLTVAVVVTVACVPLLLLDLVWSSGSAAPTAGASGTVVVAVDEVPIEESPGTTAAPAAEPPAPAPAPAAPVNPAPVVARAAVPAPSPVTTPAATPATTRPPTTTPPPPPPIVSGSDAEFLACVRARESGGNYGIVDASGSYMGAYQFSQSTWDAIAGRVGRDDLVGVRPNLAAPGDQDAIALATLAITGRSPWGGVCG